MKRRELLKLSVLTAGLGVISSKAKSQQSNNSFNHGVASGDPTEEKVILWTRVTTSCSTRIIVILEVSNSLEFQNVVFRKELFSDPTKDYTVKYDFNAGDYFGQGETFYFRFHSQGIYSEIGKSQTFPIGDTSFACLSCSNYPTGFFNAYKACADERIDFWLHLGDYIYEYSDTGYGTEDARALDRVPKPSHEIITLADYRMRHAQYKSDEGSKKLHSAAPLIAVWDDHEFANDTWMRGAENHAFDGSEGSFIKRRAAAIRAYLEWMPIREQPVKRRIYRQFKNKVINLLMLDTRQFGRDKQIQPLNYLDTGVFDKKNFFNSLNAKDRELLGKPQLNWIKKNLYQNNSTWVVAGQQILMARVKFPKIIDLLDGKAPPKWLSKFLPLQEEDIPSNLDAWDGYPHARAELYKLFKDNKTPIISLAGDTHNSWVSNLLDDMGNSVGFELGTPSVTSPGVADSLKIDAMKMAQGIKEHSPELEWIDAKYRGYLICRANNQSFTAQFKFIDNIKNRDFKLINGPIFRASKGSTKIFKL
ncbi:MAG: alkaline phosphatase D family protein [Gammaproteobacteria bacterium]